MGGWFLRGTQIACLTIVLCGLFLARTAIFRHTPGCVFLLSVNNIGDDGAIEFADVLKHNTTLTSLNLGSALSVPKGLCHLSFNPMTCVHL